MPTLYIDVLLTLNLFVDYLLLCGTARVLSRPSTRKRLIAAALVGALSTLVILLPPLPWWLTLTWQASAAAAMVAVGFPFERVGTFLKTATVFFIISALFAGVCFAVWWGFAPRGMIVQSGVVYYDVPAMWLVVFTAISYGVLCLYDRLTRKRLARGTAYRLELIDGNDRVVLRAMMDSGHSLIERFSGSPVVVVRADAIQAMASRFDPHNINAHTAARIRYVPYSTIGGAGILTAFRPERILLHGGGHAVDVSGTWIATTEHLSRGEYDALISAALAERVFAQ